MYPSFQSLLQPYLNQIGVHVMGYTSIIAILGENRVFLSKVWHLADCCTLGYIHCKQRLYLRCKWFSRWSNQRTGEPSIYLGSRVGQSLTRELDEGAEELDDGAVMTDERAEEVEVPLLDLDLKRCKRRLAHVQSYSKIDERLYRRGGT